MRVSDLDVSAAPYTHGSFLVGGYYGPQRVITVLDRVDLDDYFERGWPHLDDAQRRLLVESNKEMIGKLMQKKCEAGEWQDERLAGGTVKQIAISRADLFGIEPRLSDDCIKGTQHR
ncbi:hypothetical protein [Bradyrhizobium cosmicum]|uniref:hypothetical protein n=1 Tax=Bradyrhizobium cosmicum TaxID=1404864 RepID=UPI0028F0C482|nr:hypothetical protein [Bradyrhizobium cosmicum]